MYNMLYNNIIKYVYIIKERKRYNLMTSIMRKNIKFKYFDYMTT